ncbi:MAG: 3'(2'),5'-bisphosphate nucleotidase [Nevskiaceae bacterium]|nr:MAG: 3'(2'),5'-bisphosphate nucleotidase [Nevskiaceae bacterium]TBR72488.1 MAG: 3'(2'),5'-bisphosphate nucleotidase [Nevskiaceae bacterium]
MNFPELPDLLDHCEAIAHRAGAAVMAVYETDFTVEDKPDGSPLTAADLAANDIISRELQLLGPSLPYLSEEGASVPYGERLRWARYWLVDPLDGTREFVKRNGDFTVNIALIEGGIPVLGVVHVPTTDTLYSAARDLGAWRTRAGQRVAIHARKAPAQPVVATSRSHRTAALERLLSRLPAHETIGRGSSLKFCLVAQGSADFYPRSGPTCEWDTAAGQCVAEQAGCEVVSLPEWRPLRYNTKASLINPAFAVAGDPAYNWHRFLVNEN